MAKDLVSLLDDRAKARYWAGVDKRGPDECWPWLNNRSPTGYGRLKFGGKCTQSTHAALTLDGRPMPFVGAYALHSCDNPPCQNPRHLRWGDAGDNMQDLISRNRSNWASGKTHYSHTKPELMARGDRNGSRLYPERLKRGEANARAKLCEAQVVDIRASKDRVAVIAKKYAVSPSLIRLIIRRSLWKHVA